jgi:hypothetical protein
MATITSTTKIDSIMKKVFSSLTDPRGRIKKDTTKNIIFCIIYITSPYGSIWDLLATYDNIYFDKLCLTYSKIKEQDREY